MKTLIISAAKLVVTFALLVWFSGCASPADPAAMVPQTANIGKCHPHSVAVAVSGGHGTNPLWTSQVSNEDFKKALESSLTKHRVFSSVVQAGGGEYRLDVTLVRLDQPFAGLDLKVTAEVTWKLTDARSGRVVWQDTTTSAYTATFGDAVVAFVRLKLANEGAIRESIKTGIERVSKVAM